MFDSEFKYADCNSYKYSFLATKKRGNSWFAHFRKIYLKATRFR
jgi:hypothetical protein